MDIDGMPWKNRYMAFLDSLTPLLDFLRDKEKIALTEDLSVHLHDFQALEKLAWDMGLEHGDVKRAPGYFKVTYAGQWDAASRPLQNYLLNLPAYDQARVGNQKVTVEEHFNYMAMQRPADALAHAGEKLDRQVDALHKQDRLFFWQRLISTSLFLVALLTVIISGVDLLHRAGITDNRIVSGIDSLLPFGIGATLLGMTLYLCVAMFSSFVISKRIRSLQRTIAN